MQHRRRIYSYSFLLDSFFWLHNDHNRAGQIFPTHMSHAMTSVQTAPEKSLLPTLHEFCQKKPIRRGFGECDSLLLVLSSRDRHLRKNRVVDQDRQQLLQRPLPDVGATDIVRTQVPVFGIGQLQEAHRARDCCQKPQDGRPALRPQ
jgi:hypothetical protein